VTPDNLLSIADSGEHIQSNHGDIEIDRRVTRVDEVIEAKLSLEGVFRRVRLD
jgi:hypothetical protein